MNALHTAASDTSMLDSAGAGIEREAPYLHPDPGLMEGRYVGAPLSQLGIAIANFDGLCKKVC
jgi:hypothetical protein